MLVIVKSAPSTPEGKRGITMAKDMAANIVLTQNAVYFAQEDRLDSFSGIIYALEDGIRLRGLRDDEFNKGVKKLDYDGLIKLMIEEDKVIGIF